MLNVVRTVPAARFVSRRFSSWLFLALLFGAVLPIEAQFTTARLSGVVSDASGGVVPGATVTVTEQSTG